MSAVAAEHPLELCLRLLSTMGEPGKWIWLVGKAIRDPEERVRYLRRAISWLRKKAQQDGWVIPPVDFRTFVESESLLNKASVLWPEVLREGEEINSGKYVEVVLTGGIGVAKSTLALYTQAYQLYVLTCMENPHEAFDLDPSSEILIVFQSITKDLAKDVDYGRFRAMVDDSPYFRKYAPYDQERASDMRFTNSRIVIKPVAGHDTAAIGQNVIGGVLDEVNFMAVTENSKQTKDGTTYDQAMSNYNSIARRRESRFMQKGELPGMLCLVSSRNYPGQFTDKKEQEAKTNPRIYIYDKRLWEIRPERFAGEKFHVFVGDQTRKPRILQSANEIAEHDQRLVMAIPVEYRKTFENDLLPALRDVAGVATQALHPFMLNSDAVADCFGKTLSILSREDCDFVKTKVLMYPKRVVNPFEWRFAHIDLALSKDSAGVSVGHVPGFVDVNRGDHVETLPIIQFDCILEVRPPQGDEIRFESIRQLIYDIRDKLMLPVRWVSFDQYQSRDSMQVMATKGFSTGYQSMDTDTHAYDLLKQAYYDGRVKAPAHPKALHECITLEFNAQKNKIDHPPHSSKDVSDSMAGVAIGLTRRREIWNRHQIPTYRIPKQVFDLARSGGKDSIEAKEAKERPPHEVRRYGS
ncbi:hypothetical protein [Hyphomicrobium sp. ghe19]|uniref:hypothetical protein n=1 Tax=Hyphomicrobium sp. ghe19 TaxID=2682968 RepID=UPI00136767E6|nr:hypothetical protein HYPP_02524 [Hyphomicrobium sp. ghe19]